MFTIFKAVLYSHSVALLTALKSFESKDFFKKAF